MDVRVSVLLVNLNNLEFTKNCILDLLNQDTIFNLRIVDQNSTEPGTKEFLDELFIRHINGDFFGKINFLEIGNSGYNKPLNHLWNDFANESSTEFICLLNNDTRLSPNFLSSSISVLDRESIVKVVNHTTNSLQYSRWRDELDYVIKDSPYRQGWDIFIRKLDWEPIPESLEFFFGDDFIYSKIYSKGYKGAYVLNSPIIHYERSTTIEKSGVRDCSKDSQNYDSLNLEITNLSFDESYSKWKPEFESITKKITSSYSKESYITRDVDVKVWRSHLNTKILKQYENILTGNVADFGCNHGACTIIASESEKINQVIGIDINESSLLIGNDLLDKHNVRKVKYLHSNLLDIKPISDDYFDNAYSFHTLEHIIPSDYDDFFKEIKRVVKHNGHIIFSVPYEHAYDDPTHMNYFNETTLTELVSKYGIKVSECYRDRTNGFDCLNLVGINKKENDILLSILIPSLVERNGRYLSRLIYLLNKQIVNKPVELLILTDNAKRPIGTKRNDLLKISKGKYITFIDDDDRVSDDYVTSILNEIYLWSPDVIVFDAEISFNGKNPKLVKYGREFDYCEKPDSYYRHPNHLMVHKRENITEFFKDIKTGEDDEWALRMLPKIVTQSRIDKVLYYYDYNTNTKKYFD